MRTTSGRCFVWEVQKRLFFNNVQRCKPCCAALILHISSSPVIHIQFDPKQNKNVLEKKKQQRKQFLWIYFLLMKKKIIVTEGELIYPPRLASQHQLNHYRSQSSNVVFEAMKIRRANTKPSALSQLFKRTLSSSSFNCSLLCKNTEINELCHGMSCRGQGAPGHSMVAR